MAGHTVCTYPFDEFLLAVRSRDRLRDGVCSGRSFEIIVLEHQESGGARFNVEVLVEGG